MKKNKQFAKIILFLLLALAFIFYPGPNQWQNLAMLDAPAFTSKEELKFQPKPIPLLRSESFTNPFLSAQAYVVMDLDSFTPIMSKNARQKLYPASTVKLATAMVALKNYQLEDILTVKQPVEQEYNMDLVKAERISVLNLLYGTLILSANDAALALAQNHPQGQTAFVKQMNALAKSLNMQHTHFIDPIGFDNKQQYTTPRDLALLAREFSKNPLLLNITSTKNITVADADFTRFHTLNNVNELLGDIPNLGGLKTGTTEKAGQNLISFYRYRGKPILLVVMKGEDRFNDTRQLINLLNQSLVFQPIN
jgi:serine-type D-Ala-D-Ala carboxypeptidase (penicillin-binding protein 5/6)